MKKQSITKEVIRLARKIAEYWRMEIYEGCWVLRRGEVPDNPVLVDKEIINLLNDVGYGDEDITIIPSISDCEQKLVELGYEFMNLMRRPFKDPWMVKVWDAESHDLDADTIKRWDNKGETLHEALLSTLLEVLKNERLDTRSKLWYTEE